MDATECSEMEWSRVGSVVLRGRVGSGTVCFKDYESMGLLRDIY